MIEKGFWGGGFFYSDRDTIYKTSRPTYYISARVCKCKKNACAFGATEAERNDSINRRAKGTWKR